MNSLASRVGSGETDLNISTHKQPSKSKTYGFITDIISGIGKLSVAAAEVVGIVKTGHERGDATHKSGSTELAEIIRSIGLVYGPEVWPELGKKWGCELKILDVEIPDAPEEDVAGVRIYIPQRVSVNGEEKDFTLNTLIEMGGGPFEICERAVRNQFGNKTASGWIEIDRDVIPESRSKDYNTQKEMVEKKDCRIPSVLEAVVLNLMVFAFTGERLYGGEPLTYTRCSEEVDGKYPVVVGAFGRIGLNCHRCYFNDYRFGVATLRKFQVIGN